MPQKPCRPVSAFFATLGVLVLCSPLLAHPGHRQCPLAPLPKLRMAEGTVISGYVRNGLNADGSYTFAFEGPDDQKREQNFQRPDGDAPLPREGNPPAANDGDKPRPDAPPGVQTVAHAVGDPKRETSFTLRSPEVADGGALPKEFTGDGAAATLPLEWSNAPAGTRSFALIMHHIPGPGDVKWYWVLYNIPPDVHSLPKNVKGVGTLGNNSVNGRSGYAPPHSKGPGAKTYVLTVYALSAAIKDRTLASAELKVVYDRTGIIDAGAPPGPGPGDAPGPPRDGTSGGGAFHLIPRDVEDKLKLTADQQQGLTALERETEEKLAKILTPEQVKVLQEARPPRQNQGGPDQPGR
jgi:phosphatidylethanolamine-binding protein (PEBP) family uncharacterized protein